MTIKKLKSIDIINVLSDLVSKKLETTVKLPIGWTYETGLAVILTNSKGGTKRMFVGNQYKRMTDGKHPIDIVDGYGEFICDAASLNIYVKL